MNRSGQVKRVESISGSLEDIATSIWLSNNGDLLYTGTYESYKISIEDNDIINASELNVFNHVSGTYYDRQQYSFLARKSGFAGPIGINPYEEDRIQVYPNPSSGMLYIHIKDHSGKVPIKVYDLGGRVVDETLADDNTSLINLSDHQPGMYVISIIDERRVVNKQVLILR
jgi:hypothetical protein